MKNSKNNSEKLCEQFLGCILGGAVGDALGAPVEFLQREEIIDRFGLEGIDRLVPSFGSIGSITDDTQMTLFTAEGLLRSWVHQSFYGEADYRSITAHAYLRWLKTQGETPNCDLSFADDEPGWLLSQNKLHSRRAPGITCLSSLRSMTYLGQLATNESKGCGGLMRAAPVGLFTCRLPEYFTAEECFALGTDLAALTHGHPSGNLAAGFLSTLVFFIAQGNSLNDAIELTRSILIKAPRNEEVLSAVDLACDLSKSDTSPEKCIRRIGLGWIAEEALGIAIYCALIAKNFKSGVTVAVNHDGDSDSTGAIAGNLLGLIHGVESIPSDWLLQLELVEVLTEIADDLMEFRDWDIGPNAIDSAQNEQVWWKYPGF